MPEFERSAPVRESASAAFDYLSDPRNLSEYVATMVRAEALGGGRLLVAADVEGRHEEGPANYRADPASRRVEWDGGRDGVYRGWLSVKDRDGSGGATVTIHLTTADSDDGPEIERALGETLGNVQRILGPA